MRPFVIDLLLDLNRKFYVAFGNAFAQTRHRIQSGVGLILEKLDKQKSGDWLDLGCGSSTLAHEWGHRGRTGSYTGMDFSPVMLSEAEMHAGAHQGLVIRFLLADLTRPAWMDPLGEQKFDGVMAFAVLHHIPDSTLRRQLLTQVHGLLKPGGLFIHSEWQFQHSPRLLARIQPWETIGLSSSDVDDGDVLMDWRFALPGQSEKIGLRYVHQFARAELYELAQSTHYDITDEFESDGKEGTLALYQIWRAS